MVQGQRMWLDEKDTLELATREVYEPAETTLFKREIRPGQVVLDIGANIGYYTLIAAKLVGPKGRVIAFEPDPANFALLKKNVEANGHKNVTLVQKALSDKNGKARLYLNPTNKGDHRLYDSGDGRSFVTVTRARLDDVLLKLDRQVHFIKMDVQGAEASVLRGMKGLLRRSRSLKLVTEFSPGGLRLQGDDPLGYLKTLQKAGFRLQEIPAKGGTLRSVDAKALVARLGDDSNAYANLFCVKN
jgi:FkbM family methyltransferase